MPRQPKHSAEYVYDTLKHLRFIDPDGNLLPWADNVWATAVEAMNGTMTKEHLWLYIKKDRYGVSKKIHGISQTDIKDDTLGTSRNDSRDDLNWSMEDAACPFPSLRTEISISKKEWGALKTHIAQYKEREYEVLIIGWADAVYEIIWNHLKLPCPFSFRSYVNRNPGEIFLKIRGSCRECSFKINIYCTEEPKSENLDLHISTFDTRGVVHEKKRQIRGDKRLRIGKELQGTSTYTWRREKAREDMSFGDVVPAHIPTEEVLRKTKQEVRDKELGVFKAKSALATLWDWKHTLYKDVIYEIGLDKFYVMYWSPTQTHMFKKFLRQDCDASISIDATGSLVKQIQNPDNSKRVIYLYQAVCGYQGKILPIFQLLSEKHDTNTLTYWMREWLRSGGLCPKQVVVDYSMALLNAVSFAFNNKDLKAYIDSILKMSVDLSTILVESPRCVIRIDIAHLIKMVARWQCFTHQPVEKKDFFLRCVGLLTTCETVENFVCISTDVVTVASSKEENDQCHSAYSRLISLLKSYDTAKIILSDQSESFDDYLQSSSTNDQDVTDNIAMEKIFNKIKFNGNCGSDGKLNGYYCAEFADRFIKLAGHFVLWTDILGQNGASSARSEEYFREIKHLVLKKGKAIRVDKFLRIHLNSLEGTNKLLNAQPNSPNKSNLGDELPEEKSFCDEEASDMNILNEVENWRGKTTSSQNPTKKRGMYLSPCPEIEFLHKRPKFTPVLPLLKNGNRLGPLKIDKQTVKLTNTCAFDCTAQSLLVAISDYASYLKYAEDNDCKLFKLVKTLSTSAITSKIYEMRGAILVPTKKVENGIFDGVTNISYLHEKFILNEVPSLEKSIECTVCTFTNIKTLPVLHLDPMPIQKLGMRGLQEALSLICRVRSTETCFRCKSDAIKKELSVGPHIMINIEDVGNPLVAERNGYPYCRKQFTIREIPEKVVFGDCEYALVSAIVYAGGHYVAFIKRVAGKWEEHDDLKDRVINVSSRTLLQKQNIHVLFYVRVSQLVNAQELNNNVLV